MFGRHKRPKRKSTKYIVGLLRRRATHEAAALNSAGLSAQQDPSPPAFHLSTRCTPQAIGCSRLFHRPQCIFPGETLLEIWHTWRVVRRESAALSSHSPFRSVIFSPAIPIAAACSYYGTRRGNPNGPPANGLTLKCHASAFRSQR